MNAITTYFGNTLRKAQIYRKRQLKFDLIASVVVFLLSIPFCLGISLASGAPLFSGILSAIIGGLVVGSLSSSHVSVSGPAAGMAAVILAAVTQLGDFNVFLLALLISGLLQLLMGLFRAGFIADYIPSNIIQGLMCAVGILLIAKELPLAFTLSHSLTELKMQLLDTSEELSIQPLQYLSMHINTGAAFISLSSLGIMFFLERTSISWMKIIPSTILIVLFGVLTNELFVLFDSSLMQNSPHLVRIPKHNGFVDFYNHLKAPNWSAWSNPKIYLYAVIIAAIGSLENLVNINAGEKLDKQHRHCSKDRELIAQGIGNSIAGLIGGIAITSGIIRTSVNIEAGAKTKMSTILHGTYILMMVILFPGILNRIPLSSLAAILIYTGYQLTKPSIYLSMYNQGRSRFLPFIITVISILLFNLLCGVLVGLAVSLYYILKSSSQARLDIIKEIYPNGITNRIVLPQQTTFLNKASLVAELDSIPPQSQLIIDARYSDYIDKEIVELIKEFQAEQVQHREISLNLMGFKEHYDIHNFINFINVTTYDVQATLSPVEVLNILLEGNQRFLNDTRIHRSFKIDIQHTASTQHPIAVVLGCIDSRVPVETIFDMSFGDLFCVRVAGNVVNEDVLASIEYACHVVGAKLIVVLGHTRCGAIAAACDQVNPPGHITQLLTRITPAITAEKTTTENRNSQNTEYMRNVTELNIANTLVHIYQESTILRNMITKNDIGIVGAVYDVSSGQVHCKDFAPVLNTLTPKHPAELAQRLHEIIVTCEEKNPHDHLH